MLLVKMVIIVLYLDGFWIDFFKDIELISKELK